jgi:hypothetical protein
MFKILRRPYIPIMGITSRCFDGNHVLFAEFDHIRRDMMEEYAKLAIDKFKLTHIYIFRSSKGEYIDGTETGNYHWICLKKMSIRDVCDIQSFLPIDSNYGRAWMFSYYKSWVLRTSKKMKKKSPVFLTIVYSPHQSEVSTAHKEAIEKFYGVPKIDYIREDHSGKLFTQRYMTSHA